MMRGYADMTDCRREYVLNYFGEIYAPPCHSCDNCLSGLSDAKPSSTQPFPINGKVVHKVWGPGLVMRYASDTMVVLFALRRLPHPGRRPGDEGRVACPSRVACRQACPIRLEQPDAIDGIAKLKGSGTHGHGPVSPRDLAQNTMTEREEETIRPRPRLSSPANAATPPGRRPARRCPGTRIGACGQRRRTSASSAG